MYMKDWIQKLDDFLRLSGKELLQHAGTISAELAKKKQILNMMNLRNALVISYLPCRNRFH